jgi:predicted dehydrogenase
MVSRTPGSHNWAVAFAAVPETEIVAVYDRGPETRDAFTACWGPVATFDDYQRMLEETRPDVVCVATRQTQHADQIESAIAAGARGILSDKPLATSPAEAQRILAACQGAAVPLAFGLDRRWSLRYRAARQAIAGGLVGQPQTVIAYGVPNLINHGCHWYDAALMLVGDPEVAQVSGGVDPLAGEPPGSRRRLDPPGRAQVELANGVVMYVTPDGGPAPAFEVVGKGGRLLLLNDARDAALWTLETPAGGAARLRATPMDLPSDAADWPAGPAVVRDLVRAIEAGGPTACDVDATRRATAIGFAIHESSRRGGMRVALADVDPALRIESFPWGNE